MDTLTEALQRCDEAIEHLRQAQTRPDVALLLLDARMLLVQPEHHDTWDRVLVQLFKESA